MAENTSSRPSASGRNQPLAWSEVEWRLLTRYRHRRDFLKPFADIDTARLVVEQYSGPPEDFQLPISDEIQDPMGIAMAIITDAIIAKGWELDGFEQCDGYRVYRYKTAD